MRIEERYKLAADLAERYWAAGRRERGALLDAFCLTTGYSRKYHQRTPRPPAEAPVAAQAAAKALRQALPGRTGGDLGGRWLYLCRAPASLPARPAAAARASWPTLAGATDQGPAAGRQHPPIGGVVQKPSVAVLGNVAHHIKP
jgi:hypothetical protein